MAFGIQEKAMQQGEGDGASLGTPGGFYQFYRECAEPVQQSWLRLCSSSVLRCEEGVPLGTRVRRTSVFFTPLSGLFTLGAEQDAELVSSSP